MNEVFNITVDMKVAEGYVEYCRFFINTNLKAAQDTFDQLSGLPYTNNNLLLRLSFVRSGSLPDEVLATKYCTLDELGRNCRLITLELFKYYNLDQYIPGDAL
ncbi:hypothetical protein U0035_21430 [Niabella yanshanensis]|uniref:Uncharacterized protein n=1 Tax=Niabella yanshanensis TaxID=577386 RepID=A0ABZ0W547_9BACT|nr:hypothetical protein [Niabella yanshanensis]WQD38236.1 hypothetical protein U0035_21430 [Niabella yanshanensis]